jgi:parallel beta-helix repeat protein
MRACMTCLGAGSILVLCMNVSATVLQVPGEYPTIQAGIDAAAEGDTVLVADGVYTGDGNRNLDFGGVNIVVMSENGPEPTIIDCQGIAGHRGFYFHSGEDTTSVVQGFTIRNGYAEGTYPYDCGGGIYCSQSSPRIEGNRISGNNGSYGGGIFCYYEASPTIVGNAITENMARDWTGGGISCWYSSPIIKDNTISGNTAQTGYGGGIFYTYYSSPTIVANTIGGNLAAFWGGGIGCSLASGMIVENMITNNTVIYEDGGGISCANSSSTMILGNTITGNVGSYWGGGIACWGSSLTIAGNIITRNTAGRGSGIFCDESSPIIEDNTIRENTASDGGGIYCQAYSSPTIVGNTIAENSATDGGGGILCRDYSSPTIAGNRIMGNLGQYSGGGIDCDDHSSPAIVGNTIARNVGGFGGAMCSQNASFPAMVENTTTENTAYWGGAIYCANSSAMLLNSILWGDSASAGWEIYLSSGGTVNVVYSDVEGGWEGEGNIDTDPRFVLAEKSDCRLLWGSPCIDAGHPDSLDPDGTRSDMGAHFFDQDDYMTLYLTPDETEVVRGGVLGVTYTAINRWAQPEPFWVLTKAILPNGNPFPVMGPDRYVLPAETIVQRHLTRSVPSAAPLGKYGYGSKIGVPPSTLYDEDSFTFTVLEP